MRHVPPHDQHYDCDVLVNHARTVPFEPCNVPARRCRSPRQALDGASSLDDVLLGTGSRRRRSESESDLAMVSAHTGFGIGGGGGAGGAGGGGGGSSGLTAGWFSWFLRDRPDGAGVPSSSSSAMSGPSGGGIGMGLGRPGDDSVAAAAAAAAGSVAPLPSLLARQVGCCAVTLIIILT